MLVPKGPGATHAAANNVQTRINDDDGDLTGDRTYSAM
jgi:hypothetical protein